MPTPNGFVWPFFTHVLQRGYTGTGWMKKLKTMLGSGCTGSQDHHLWVGGCANTASNGHHGTSAATKRRNCSQLVCSRDFDGSKGANKPLWAGCNRQLRWQVPRNTVIKWKKCFGSLGCFRFPHGLPCGCPERRKQS